VIRTKILAVIALAIVFTMGAGTALLITTSNFIGMKRLLVAADILGVLVVCSALGLLLSQINRHGVKDSGKKRDQSTSNYFATIQSLVNALEANDRFTKGHSERVRMLSADLGERLGRDFRELELLEHASILHDIGKIGVDNFILQKRGKLTPKEYSLIKTHPLIGDEILGPIETLNEVRQTIIQHHERNDGTGYPYGLRGDEISLKAKILSVVDTFDAMMTDRPYRKALSVSEVKEELTANAGTQFDPLVVGAFVSMLDEKGDEFLAAVGYNTLFCSF
jgi:HD-GYP domain-containing protein (c-di-GMP phosphodiesterase class II)